VEKRFSKPSQWSEAILHRALEEPPEGQVGDLLPRKHRGCRPGERHPRGMHRQVASPPVRQKCRSENRRK